MDPVIAKLLKRHFTGRSECVHRVVAITGVMAWFAFQQGDRFKSINDRLDRLEGRLDRVEAKLERLADSVPELVIEVRTLNLRVAAL